MTKLTVTQGDTCGCGYVYLSDNTRIGYARSVDTGLPYGMFASNWGGNSVRHFELAAKWLSENFQVK